MSKKEKFTKERFIPGCNINFLQFQHPKQHLCQMSSVTCVSNIAALQPAHTHTQHKCSSSFNKEVRMHFLHCKKKLCLTRQVSSAATEKLTMKQSTCQKRLTFRKSYKIYAKLCQPSYIESRHKFTVQTNFQIKTINTACTDGDLKQIHFTGCTSSHQNDLLVERDKTCDPISSMCLVHLQPQCVLIVRSCIIPSGTVISKLHSAAQDLELFILNKSMP